MKAVYFLKWITPVLSQLQIEDLFQWFNAHLKEIHAETLPQLSKVKIIPLMETAESKLNPLLLLFFPCHLTPAAAEQLRVSIWSELFSQLTPGPLPEAVSLQSESTSMTQKKLVVFDMDSTLIDQEVIDELAREMNFFEAVSKITEAAMQGKLDFKAALIERCKLFSGLTQAQAMSIIPRLSLSQGAEALLNWLRSTSVHTAIVSGGFEFVLKSFQKKLFIDQVYGHHLESELHPETNEIFFTGQVNEPLIDASYKQKLVSQLKSNYRCSTAETVVIGDGANDVQMMTEAGISVSFCGKPKLASVANTLILKRDLLYVKALI